MKAAAECNPSPVAPPVPSPMQDGPSRHSSLALTPERPVTTAVLGPKRRRQRVARAAGSSSSSPSTEAGLSSASPLCAPPKPLPHALSHPVINSTRRLDRQLREMGKENVMGRGERGAVRLTEEALNKVVGVPVGEKVYKDLPSVEVTPSSLPHTTHKKTASRQPTTEEPDVFEFFSPDSVTEEATWEFTLPNSNQTPQFAALDTVLQLRRHLWGGRGHQ